MGCDWVWDGAAAAAAAPAEPASQQSRQLSQPASPWRLSPLLGLGRALPPGLGGLHSLDFVMVTLPKKKKKSFLFVSKYFTRNTINKNKTKNVSCLWLWVNSYSFFVN